MEVNMLTEDEEKVINLFNTQRRNTVPHIAKISNLSIGKVSRILDNYLATKKK